MATSGSFDTNVIGSFYFTFEWSRTGYDSTKNEQYIYYRLYAHNTAGKYRTVYLKNLYVNGSQVYYQAGTSGNGKAFYDGDEVTSGNATISNYNDAGDGSFSASFEAGVGQYPSGNCSGSGSWNLDRIPRYASITQFDLSAVNETSIKFTWSASNSCDAVQYSLNGGSWTNGVYPTTTISSLSANTQYSVKIRVKRADSQLWTESGTKNATTYNYPYITAVTTADLTIGNQQKLTLYNPLSRSVTVKMNKDTASGTQLYSGTTSSTSISFTPTASTLYASIPSATSGKCVYSVVYGSSTKSTTGNYTYKIKNTEVPTFSNFTYKDTNSTVTGVTGNNQVLVKGLSTLQVTISSANKMVANNSATAKSYTAVIDTLNVSTNYSSSDLTFNVGTVVNSGTKRLTVTAYDSRNLSKAVYKDITVYEYQKPVVNTTLSRLNNFENQTTLKVSGTYSRLTISNADKNTITSVQYRYRETGGTWSGWTTLTTTVTTGNFNCSDVILSLDNTKSFEFEIRAIDKLQTQTVTNTVGVGQAIFFIGSNTKKCYINGKEIPVIDANRITQQYFRASNRFEIPKNGSAGYGITNTDGVSIIRDHNNNCVTVDATGGTLFLGYQTTTGINFLNGKANMDSNGYLTQPRIHCDVYYSGGGDNTVTSYIQFNNVRRNIGGGWDTSKKGFVAPRTGLYLANFWYFSNGTNSSSVRPAILEYNTSGSLVRWAMCTGNAPFSISKVFYLEKGQMLRCGVNTSTWNLNFYGAENHNGFDVTYLG